MFDSLVREARSTVDNALSGLVYRVVFGILLLVALGFATASFSIWINRQLGAETGNLVVAAVFLVAGLIVYLMLPGAGAAAPEPERTIAASDTGAEAGATQPQPMSPIDKELLYSAATAALPMALPKIVGFVLRHLPLIAALASAVYIAMRATSDRPPGTDADADPAVGEAGIAPAE